MRPALQQPQQAESHTDRLLLGLQNIDESQLNYELVERLVCHIVEAEAAAGPGALLNPGDRGAAEKAAGAGGAILIFMTGAAEIDRTVSRVTNARCSTASGAVSPSDWRSVHCRR